MLRWLAALSILAAPALGLRRSGGIGSDQGGDNERQTPSNGTTAAVLPPAPRGFRLLTLGDLAPHCMVDSHHRKPAGTSDVARALRDCTGNPQCTGVQSERGGGVSFRIMHGSFDHGSCLSNYRGIMRDRGFQDIPVVPLAEADGNIYMREDCMDGTVDSENNTYWGVPWRWTQSGHALVNESGFGVSPLLDLVTPSVLEDVIAAGVPPWHYPPGTPEEDRLFHVDVSCKGGANYKEVIEALRARGGRGRDGGALVADIGLCICHMLSNGWDPEQELGSDVVLLLSRDENFSPGVRPMDTAVFSHMMTGWQCVHRNGTASRFADDVEAFGALAENPRVLGMYFIQTPPITHEKVWLTPLGIDTTHYLPDLLPFVQPGAPERRQQRTALYDVSHNLAVDYRRAVFQAVQESFGDEPLRVRYLPWAVGGRIADVAKETLGAVFGQSPIGIGENCFRHVELLLSGTIPVVQASTGVAALRYLPHLAVSNWHEVTPQLLRESYRAIWERARRGDFSFEPLTNGFWRRHILDTALGREAPAFYAKFPNPAVTCEDWNCVEPSDWTPLYHPRKRRRTSNSLREVVFLGNMSEWLEQQRAAEAQRQAARAALAVK